MKVNIRVKKGVWEKVGRAGVMVGDPIYINGASYTPVMWDVCNPPEFHPSVQLEEECAAWKPVKRATHCENAS